MGSTASQYSIDIGNVYFVFVLMYIYRLCDVVNTCITLKFMQHGINERKPKMKQNQKKTSART